MKPALTFLILCIVLFSCHKPGDSGNTTILPQPLDTNCPTSCLGNYTRSSRTVTGASATITTLSDSPGFYVFRSRWYYGDTMVIYTTLDCDSNSFDIPEQPTEYMVFNRIKGSGHIYPDKIVLNYSLYDHVEYNRWFDGNTDTLRR